MRLLHNTLTMYMHQHHIFTLPLWKCCGPCMSFEKESHSNRIKHVYTLSWNALDFFPSFSIHFSHSLILSLARSLALSLSKSELLNRTFVNFSDNSLPSYILSFGIYVKWVLFFINSVWSLCPPVFASSVTHSLLKKKNKPVFCV